MWSIEEHLMGSLLTRSIWMTEDFGQEALEIVSGPFYSHFIPILCLFYAHSLPVLCPYKED